MPDQKPVIAIVGQGVMGAGVSAHLISRGFRIITCLTGRSDETKARAQDAGAIDLGSLEALAAEADFIFSILPTSKALPFAAEMANHLGDKDQTYVDFNAITPMASAKIGDLVEAKGANYIDAAITGPPPVKRVTNFYLSGPSQKSLRFLADPQIALLNCGNENGKASALKLCVSASTKARIMTYLMALIAAKKAGIYELYVAAQKQSDPVAWNIIENTGPRMAAAAGRWGEEFDAVADMMRDVGLPPTLYEGVSEMFQHLEGSSLGQETKETLDPTRSIDQFVSTLTREVTLSESNH